MLLDNLLQMQGTKLVSSALVRQQDQKIPAVQPFYSVASQQLTQYLAARPAQFQYILLG